MPAVMQVFIAVIIISAIVGAVAQMLSKMSAQNNNNNQPNRRQNPERNRGGGGAVRQSNSDVDRFLAEIDRLRQRTELPTAQPASRPAARPPGRQRPVAEPVRPPSRAEAQTESAYSQPPSPILSSDKPGRTEELPQVSSLPQAAPPPLPTISHSLPPIPTMPANPVTPRAVLARKRAAPRTEFAAQLTALLGTKGGLPMAIVLTEILGKPKSRPM